MKNTSPRGSILLSTLIFVLLMAGIAASLLSLAESAEKLTRRNQVRARAQAVAESELEYLYFSFKARCLAGATASSVSAQMTAIADNADVPTTNRTPFLVAHQADGWRVRRSIATDRSTLQGNLPNSTKVGQYTYLNARIQVRPPLSSPFHNTLSVCIGRRLINSTSTIFQYSVFYQGDLEMTPGSDTVITGDIAVNGNVYLGSPTGKTLTINNKLKYSADKLFNQVTAADAAGLTIFYNPNGTAPPVSLVAPVFATSQASQVETMNEPENLLGGIDPMATAEVRTDLFAPTGSTDPTLWSAAEKDVALNNVYRSTIAPPPAASTVNEYPNISAANLATTGDDPAIEASRAFTRADIVVVVTAAGVTSVINKTNGADITAALSAAISAPTSVYDQREGKAVAVTTIDIGALAPLLQSAAPAFNGVMYVNLLRASGATPSAVRLTNGAQLPNVAGTGFSIATNGGMYVQGSYNTQTAPLTPGKVPAMLMSDALTVLSSTWSDANAAGALSTRTVTAGTTVQINAGLLTGTTATTGTANSGGAQNLARYLESWSGSYVNFNGSIGRLFQSKHFQSPYTGPGTVYMPPARNFAFDSQLARTPPPGSPTTTSYSRGNFFSWTP